MRIQRLHILVLVLVAVTSIVGGCAVLFILPFAKDMPLVRSLRTIPVLPDAQVEIDGRTPYPSESLGWGLWTEIQYRTQHSTRSEAVAFYIEQMPQRGWTLDSRSDDDFGGFPATCLLYKQDTSQTFATVGILDYREWQLVSIWTVAFRPRCVALGRPRPESTE